MSIGTKETNSNAVLQLVSPDHNQGFLMPRVTTSQRLTMNLKESDNGMVVYDQELGTFFYWHGGKWNEISNSKGDFSNGGEAKGTNRTLGNTDNYGLGFLTNNNTHLYINNNGNVGIGTVVPGAKLEVSGGAIRPSIGSSRDAGIEWLNDPVGGADDRAFIKYITEGSDDTRMQIGIINDQDDEFDIFGSGGINLITGPNPGYIGDFASPITFNKSNPDGSLTERMRINEEGKVGIGVTDPGGLFGLKNNSTWLDVDDSNNLTFTDAVTGTKTLAELAASSGVFWSSTAGGIYYNSGRVGIGTTTPRNDALLDVTGHTRIGELTVDGFVNGNETIMAWGLSGNGWLGLKNAVSGNEWRLDIDRAGNDDFSIKTDPENTTPFYIQRSTGFVGIGTEDPRANLDVYGSNAVLRVGPYYVNDIDHDYIELIADPFDTRVRSFNERFHIENTRTDGVLVLQSSGGNVGIGTETPTDKLQVNGDIRIGIVTEDNGSTPDYGNRLYFSGGDDWPDNGDSDNSDEIWMARYNVASDQSELRINVGDEGADAFKVGMHRCCGVNAGEWISFLTVKTNRSVGINTSNPSGLLFVQCGNTNDADSSFVVSEDGNVGIGSTPDSRLDINGYDGFNQLRLRKSYTPTGSGDTNGNTGDLAWDQNFIYVKTNAGWKRATLSTW